MASRGVLEGIVAGAKERIQRRNEKSNESRALDLAGRAALR
jgi:hypothetical protein